MESFQESSMKVESYEDEHLAVDFSAKIVLLDKSR
jgi:hypothetical protein